jgi:hypothetical protein
MSKTGTQATPKGRFDRELRRAVHWWEFAGERFPRTLFAAGSTTRAGHSIDLQTGIVTVKPAQAQGKEI